MDKWIVLRVAPDADTTFTVKGTTPDDGVGTLYLIEVLTSDLTQGPLQSGTDYIIHGQVVASPPNLSVSIDTTPLLAISTQLPTSPPGNLPAGHTVLGLYVFFSPGDDTVDVPALVQARAPTPGPGPDAPQGLRLDVLAGGDLLGEGAGGWPVGTLPADAIHGSLSFATSTLQTAWRIPSSPPAAQRLHAPFLWVGDGSTLFTDPPTPVLGVRGTRAWVDHVWWDNQPLSVGNFHPGWLNLNPLHDAPGSKVAIWWGTTATDVQYRSSDVVSVPEQSSQQITFTKPNVVAVTLDVSFPGPSLSIADYEIY